MGPYRVFLRDLDRGVECSHLGAVAAQEIRERPTEAAVSYQGDGC